MAEGCSRDKMLFSIWRKFRHRFKLYLHTSCPGHSSSGAANIFSTSATSQESAGNSSNSFHNTGGLNSKTSITTIRVIKAQMNKTPSGKVDFKLLDTVHINLTASTSNIPYIQSQVQEKWGSGFIIVSNDGLPM